MQKNLAVDLADPSDDLEEPGVRFGVLGSQSVDQTIHVV